MSDTSTLTELARFVGRSQLSSEDVAIRRRAMAAVTRGLVAPRPQRRSVSELLGAVLALSARARRMVMPRVQIDIDVFSPGGKRAVRITMGRNA